jgi:Tetratricopeptide repeat
MSLRGIQLRWWLVSLVLLLSFVLWWGVLIQQTESSVFARVPLLDEQYYLDLADEYMNQGDSGEGSLEKPFFMSPLYPRILALLGIGVERSPDLLLPAGFLRPLYWFQGLCWLGTALLLRLTAGRLFKEPMVFRRWLLWIPSVLFLLYRPLVIYTLMVLVETPLVFLITLLIYLLSRGRTQWGIACLAGLVLGLAVLLRGSVVVLALLPVVLFWRASGSRMARTRRIGIFLLSLIVVLTPPVLHNSRIKGSLATASLNGGLNLYLGNGPEANGFYLVLPCDLQTDPACTEELERRLNRDSLGVVEADQLWTDLARKSIQNDPLRVFGLWGKKIHLQWQASEISQLTSLDGWRAEVPLLNTLMLPWWVLVVLAGLGLVWLFDRAGNKAVILPAAALLALMSAQGLFFVVSRYRMVLVPMLCLLGLAGVLAVFRKVNFSGGNPRPGVSVVVALVISILLAVPWGLGDFHSVWPALTVANHAQRWALLGSIEQNPQALEQAAGLFKQSVDEWPSQAGPWLGYAAVLRELDRSAEADEVLQQGIQRIVNNLELRRALISEYLATGRENLALDEVRRLLRNHPDDAETLHNATVLLAGRGQVDQAVAMARHLMESHPDKVQGYVDLGILLARVGRPEQARQVFLQGLQANPDDSLLKENLSRLDGSR